MTALFAGVLFHEFFERTLGKDASQVLVLSFLGLFVAAVLLGCWLQLLRPWQYVLRNERHVLRAIVNYGALTSFVLYAVIFYSQKG